MYGVIARMSGEEPFPISKNPISLLFQNLEVAATLSLTASNSELQKNQKNCKRDFPNRDLKL